MMRTKIDVHKIPLLHVKNRHLLQRHGKADILYDLSDVHLPGKVHFTSVNDLFSVLRHRNYRDLRQMDRSLCPRGVRSACATNWTMYK